MDLNIVQLLIKSFLCQKRINDTGPSTFSTKHKSKTTMGSHTVFVTKLVYFIKEIKNEM